MPLLARTSPDSPSLPIQVPSPRPEYESASASAPATACVTNYRSSSIHPRRARTTFTPVCDPNTSSVLRRSRCVHSAHPQLSVLVLSSAALVPITFTIALYPQEPKYAVCALALLGDNVLGVCLDVFPPSAPRPNRVSRANSEPLWSKPSASSASVTTPDSCSMFHPLSAR